MEKILKKNVLYRLNWIAPSRPWSLISIETRQQTELNYTWCKWFFISFYKHMTKLFGSNVTQLPY